MKFKMKAMGRVFIVGLIAFQLVSCGSTESANGVRVTGKVDQLLEGGFARLEIIGIEGPEPVDTAYFDFDGRYVMTVEVAEPSFYRLNFNDRQFVTLILTGEESEVEINADGNDPNGFSEVSGSYDTQHMVEIRELAMDFRDNAREVSQKILEARTQGDVATMELLNTEYQAVAIEHNERIKDKIRNSLPSLAAFYGIQNLDPEANFVFIDSVSAELQKVLPNNHLVMNLEKMVDERRKLVVGSVAPEIELPTPDGEVVKLSSLRGNYVLIDFWAAWCKPCRYENPNVVRVYNKYSDRNFEIYGVSLDRTKEAWLKAIEKDGLPWVHVSDLKFWNSIAAQKYQIKAIPATYLIDPDGKIIAKNLRGRSLEAKLEEIFG